MLSSSINATSNKAGYSREIDSLQYIRTIRQQRASIDWKAGQPSMTKGDFLRDLEMLNIQENYLYVAAGSEK